MKKYGNVSIFSVGLLFLVTVALAQDYPNKTVRIVTSSVGGGSDYTARQIAQGITGPLGQPVIVDNQPTGVIPTEIVSKAPPDGYTLLLSGSIVWVVPLLQKTRYDPIRDLSPVTMLDKSPDILAVHPSLPVKSVKELIALAKARPGELNFTGGPTGSPQQLQGELFKSMAGVKMVHIAYKGGAPGIVGTINGEVQLTFVTPNSGLPHVKSGRLRGLAITSAEPSALVPGFPPISATLPGYDAISITLLFAPAKTPAPIITRVNQEVARFLTRADIKEMFFNRGVEIVASSPQEAETRMKADISKWDKVIKDAGIRLD